jgi:hypothetical protein
MKTQREYTTRYAIATITTKDASILELIDKVREQGYTHEQIYTAGLRVIQESTLKDLEQNNIA